MTHQIISNIFFQLNVLETKTRYFLTSNLPELATSRWDIGGSLESRWTRGLGTWDGHRIWKWTRAEGEENLFPDRKYISSDIEITGIPSVWIVIVEQSVRASDSRNWSSFISTNRHSHDIFLNISLQDSYLVNHFPHVLLKEFAWWEMNSEKWQSFFILIFSLAFHSLGIKLMDFKGSDSDLLLCVWPSQTQYIVLWHIAKWMCEVASVTIPHLFSFSYPTSTNKKHSSRLYANPQLTILQLESLKKRTHCKNLRFWQSELFCSCWVCVNTSGRAWAT